MVIPLALKGILPIGNVSAKGITDEITYTAIPRDTLPLDTLTPQIHHYELWQKNSRYANFNELSTPSYAIFDSAHEEVIAFCNVCDKPGNTSLQNM